MIKCKICGETTDNHQTNRRKCRPCQSNEAVAHARSLEGLPTRIYANQLRKSRERGHDKPSYTKEELKEWLLANPKYEQLHAAWADSVRSLVRWPIVTPNHRSQGQVQKSSRRATLADGSSDSIVETPGCETTT